MHKSKLRMWLPFTVWLMGAVLCGVIDHIRQSSVFLSVYLPLAAVVVVVATRKRQGRNYRFAIVQPGVVRSRLGFEVRMSNSRVEYIEGNHVVSWNALPGSGSIGRFKFSERQIKGWDEPFAAEPMTDYKKREIFKAALSALSYPQSVEKGKIHPKVGLHQVDSSN